MRNEVRSRRAAFPDPLADQATAHKVLKVFFVIEAKCINRFTLLHMSVGDFWGSKLRRTLTGTRS